MTKIPCMPQTKLLTLDQVREPMVDELWRSGTAEEVKQVENSITGQYLSGRKQIAVPKNRRKPAKTKVIEIQEACENNLKNISVKFPLGVFNCVTGVSGSRKIYFSQ